VVRHDRQFRGLCAVLDLSDLADDERFATNEARTANRALLRPLLVAKLTERPADEWFKRLSAVGVPCGPINDISEGVALATELGLAPVVTVGDIPMIRNPITFSAATARYDLPPPTLDKDGDEIRAWLSRDRS
jgi:crotonobetainyl-CoA:carnitine CoA-transferase CaiB-like acyl-CoA transferase